MKRSLRAAAAALALVGVAGLLSACSNDPSTVTTKDGKAAHNAADISFATEMIPHHRQAVEMAQIVLDRGTTADVKALAQRIKDAQSPEIAELSGFLMAFGEKVPQNGSSMGGMQHGSSDNGMGMMSDADMSQMMKMSGVELEKMFLTSMIGHHDGAIAMARTELADGSYAPAKALAQKIIDAQAKEITEMRALLKRYA